MLDKVTDQLLAEGARGKLKSAMRQCVKGVMFEIASNHVLLCEVVAAGPHEWRKKFKKVMAPLPVDETLANAVYAFFVRHTKGRRGAVEWLNKAEVITPMTEAEKIKRIEESWELVSHSSEAGKREFGTPTGDRPMKLVDIRGQLKHGLADVDRN